jgi:2-oxoglutarate ferredoxin oxidoreductase subunit alpha
VEECFEAGWRAFNLAEKYQCAVIIMTDQFLGSSLRTLDMDAVNFSDVRIDRGSTMTREDLDQLTNGYKRYQFTETGISPRALPGQNPAATYSATSDEHDEEGHFDEGIENRRRMMQKRMRKLKEAEKEMRAPRRYGPPEAETTLVCWGSTFGPCKEAADQMNASGDSTNVLQFLDLWPLSEETTAAALGECRRTVVVEQNFTSQLASLLRMTTGIRVDATLNKYDGRPFAPEEIMAGLGKEVASDYAA